MSFASFEFVHFHTHLPPPLYRKRKNAFNPVLFFCLFGSLQHHKQNIFIIYSPKSMTETWICVDELRVFWILAFPHPFATAPSDRKKKRFWSRSRALIILFIATSYTKRFDILFHEGYAPNMDLRRWASRFLGSCSIPVWRLNCFWSTATS